MKLARTLMLLLLFLPSVFLASPACAAPPVLSVMPDAGTATVTADAARWEFAARFLSDDKPLTHLFHLRNGTKSTLTIERVAVSCDCVHVQIGGASTLPVKVQPGQILPVQVSLTLHRLVPGTVSKSAWIYLHGGSGSGLRLEMHGTVRDDLSVPTPHS